MSRVVSDYHSDDHMKYSQALVHRVRLYATVSHCSIATAPLGSYVLKLSFSCGSEHCCLLFTGNVASYTKFHALGSCL